MELSRTVPSASVQLKPDPFGVLECGWHHNLVLYTGKRGTFPLHVGQALAEGMPLPWMVRSIAQCPFLRKRRQPGTVSSSHMTAGEQCAGSEYGSGLGTNPIQYT